MSDRFTTLFQLPKNLYCTESPLIVSAGVLLLDNNTQSVLVQLKFRSISEKRIKAVKLQLSACDVSGQPIGNDIDYQYLDLDIGCGDPFGTNKAIIMPNTIVRTFSIQHLIIVFVDETIQEILGPWSALPTPSPLDTAIKNPEIVKQYQLETTLQAKYIPSHTSNLWICTCGEINKSSQCTKCKTPENTVFSAYDFPSLTEHMRARVFEEQYKLKLEAQIKKEKTRRGFITFIAISLLLCIVAVAARIISLKNAETVRLEQISEIEQLINEEKFEHAFDAVLKSNLTKEEKGSFCQLLIPDMTSQFYLEQGKSSSKGLFVDGISLDRNGSTIHMTDQQGNTTVFYECDPGTASTSAPGELKKGETITQLLGGDMIYANGSVFFIETTYTGNGNNYSKTTLFERNFDISEKIVSVNLENGYISTVKADDVYIDYFGKLNNGKIILSTDLIDRCTIFDPYTGTVETDVQLTDDEYVIYRTYDWFLDG